MKNLKKISKWLGIVLSSLLVLIFIAYLIIYFKTENRINQKYSYTITDIKIPSDSVSISKGEHLYKIRGCIDCHGNDLSGKIYMDNSFLVKLTIPNLTKGKGGLPSDFSENDWIRVLTHGVDKDGKSLWIMPANESSQMSKEDIANLIAYCMSVNPVNTSLPKLHDIGPLGRIVIALDQAVVLPAEKINHSTQPEEKKIAEISAEYGKYLAVNCQGCHRTDLQGGGPLAPGYPDVPNITSAGEPGNWNEESFIKTIRTGVTPEGKKLRNEFMPWQNISSYSDDELRAIFLYLKSLPAKS